MTDRQGLVDLRGRFTHSGGGDTWHGSRVTFFTYSPWCVTVRADGFREHRVALGDSAPFGEDRTQPLNLSDPAPSPILMKMEPIESPEHWGSNRRLFSAALFPVLAGALLASPLLPGPTAAAEVQPNALRFGSVRVGATVEGSIRIFRQGNDASGLAIKVEPPAFLRVEDIQVGSQQFGPNNRGYCDIWVSVDIRRAGDFSGELRVALGREQVAVPVARGCDPRCRA